ncbi:hypothetical protein SISSUDRAFT_455734 [Sistotremastrum suecicum HHB10207 ss-3]|nr:hypothetical protein SISSUDRAFT_455734 [Sistotremastrum suecicum HHB10207 ss-3]
MLFLKARQNACTCIGKLSDELVVEVMQYCMLYEHSQPTFRLPSAFALCAKWRTIAINSPSLWSMIALPSPLNLVKLFQGRSGTCLLHVRINNKNFIGNSMESRQLGDRFRYLIPRIANLRIDWENDDPNSQSFSQFIDEHIGRKVFSSLKVLSMNDPRVQGESEALTTPALREFHFHGPPSHVLRVSVTHLVTLYYSWASMTVEQVLDLLVEFPLLEHCHIQNSRPIFSAPPRNDRLPTSLNRLKSLSINVFHVSNMRAILKYLNYPASANLSIETLLDPAGDTVTSVGFVEFVKSLLPTNFDEMATLWDFGRVVYTFAPVDKSISRLEIGFRLDVDAKVEIRGCHLFINSEATRNVSRMHLRARTLGNTRWQIEVLRNLPLLTHIRLGASENDFDNFLTALEETPDVVCPLLRSLDCTGTEFNNARMKHFLNFRQEMGVGLHELKFTKGCCQPDTDGLSSLIPQLYELDPEPASTGIP